MRIAGQGIGASFGSFLKLLGNFRIKSVQKPHNPPRTITLTIIYLKFLP